MGLLMAFFIPFIFYSSATEFVWFLFFVISISLLNFPFCSCSFSFFFFPEFIELSLLYFLAAHWASLRQRLQIFSGQIVDPLFFWVDYWKIIVFSWQYPVSLIFSYFSKFCVIVFVCEEAVTSSILYWLTLGEKIPSVIPGRDSEDFSGLFYGYACWTLLIPSWGALLKIPGLLFILQRQATCWHPPIFFS